MTSKRTTASIHGRPRNLSPISQTSFMSGGTSASASVVSDGHSRSAAVTKLQKEIKHLEEENKSLKEEMVELRDTVKQIFTESRHEKYDERRINLIKFQVIQLERQISILTEALGTRSQALWEVENTMCSVADKLRSYIAADVKGQLVPISRSDLMTLVECSESARIKLFKSVQKNTPDELGKDLLYLNPCLGRTLKQDKPLTLLDISLNRMDFVNLRHVSQVESKLSVLYKELIRIHNQVETLQREESKCRLIDGHVTASESERVKTSLLKAGIMIKDCTDDLLALSLLCPSAPWPVLKRPVVKDVPVDRVIAALPSLPTSKQEEVHHVLKSCLATLNLRINLLQKEKAVQEEELAFHRAVYDTQMKYSSVIFDAVREGCQEFEDSARNLLCAPLKSILQAYSLLETTKSKDALREILLVLKANEEQITSIVDMFENPGTENSISRSEALSTFSTEFMQTVNSLVISCQKKRDEAIQEKKEVKDSLKASDLELRQCITDLEEKYDKQWVPKQGRTENQQSSRLFVESESDSMHSHNQNSFTAIDKLDGSPRSFKSSNNKEFIHSQLFGDANDENIESISSRKNQRKSYKQAQENFVDGNTAVLKLRSFLDDNDSDVGDSVEKGVIRNLMKTPHKKKWVHDFSTSDTGMGEKLEISNDSDAMFSQTKSIARAKKPWKPDKEWNNDFTNDSNIQRYDQEEVRVTLGSRESVYQAHDESISDRHTPKEGKTEQSDGSRTRRKTGSRNRSYQVDLRVAQPKLKLKRPESVPDLYVPHHKNS